MAVYMSEGKRRRRSIVIGIVAVALGVVAGFLLGRATSTGIDDAVSDGRAKGADALAALSRLPIEYEQKTLGTGGETTAKLLESVDAAETQLRNAFAAAPWLSRGQRNTALAAVTTVRRDVESGVTADEFQQTIGAASQVIGRTFGISPKSVNGP